MRPSRTWPTRSLKRGSLRAPCTSSRGEGGVAFLERLGNWFTRALSEGLTDARGSLESGATMVGVFEVADPDAEAIRGTLSDAGVVSLHYFGSWTYTRSVTYRIEDAPERFREPVVAAPFSFFPLGQARSGRGVRTAVVAPLSEPALVGAAWLAGESPTATCENVRCSGRVQTAGVARHASLREPSAIPQLLFSSRSITPQASAFPGWGTSQKLVES
jgi:hypothetical protein